MSITAAPNQTHLNTDFSIITRMFQANAQSFEKAIAGIPEDHWLVQPSNNSNHLTWVAGHIVVMRAIVPRILGLNWSAPGKAYSFAEPTWFRENNTRLRRRSSAPGMRFPTCSQRPWRTCPRRRWPGQCPTNRTL